MSTMHQRHRMHELQATYPTGDDDSMPDARRLRPASDMLDLVGLIKGLVYAVGAVLACVGAGSIAAWLSQQPGL